MLIIMNILSALSLGPVGHCCPTADSSDCPPSVLWAVGHCCPTAGSSDHPPSVQWAIGHCHPTALHSGLQGTSTIKIKNSTDKAIPNIRWTVGSVTANDQNKPPSPPPPPPTTKPNQNNNNNDMVHKSRALIEFAKTECVSRLKHAHNVTFWSQTAWQMLAKPVCVYCNLVNEMKLKLKLPPVSLTDNLCQRMI